VAGPRRKRDTTRPAAGVAARSPRASASSGAARTRYTEALAADASENLAKIDHIVVLMLENRSFDHMLGYLRLESARADIDGLRYGMANTHNNKRYGVHHLDRRALTKAEDPPHGGASIAAQLAGGNAGFVSTFAAERPQAPDVSVPMGYYNASDLPVYDHLARQYCVCNRWFSSVPGATWPNRLYAGAGRAAGSKDGKRVPLYESSSFVRHLQRKRVSWRWYAHDVATLRLMDANFRVGQYSHFAYFDRRSLLAPEHFIDHARKNDLASVSWIDPNFVDLTFVGPSGSNDDHPPSDVMAGQELVFKVYSALVRSDAWKKTLLVVTYDEHGGFYDHVPPPAARDDSSAFRRYGVRVPALVVSPWVPAKSTSDLVFDHTSIIKTILLRFCRSADGKFPDMGARVNNADHLGRLLTLPTARKAEPAEAYQRLVNKITAWRAEVIKGRLELDTAVEAPRPSELNDLQEEVLAARRRLRAAGLPEGQP
jgi:phospholipase C